MDNNELKNARANLVAIVFILVCFIFFLIIFFIEGIDYGRNGMKEEIIKKGYGKYIIKETNGNRKIIFSWNDELETK